MALSEFELINQYFKSIVGHRKDVHLGIGDDAALLDVPEGQRLVVTVDTLVKDIHFSSDVTPEDLAHKSLVVNLSDLAAMGAAPAWVTLSLTIPEADKNWIESFSQKFAELCRYFDVQLVGGDTCRGELSVSVQAMGFVPHTSALKRSSAQPGDLIYVTGHIGDAGAGLALQQEQKTEYSIDEQFLISRLDNPTPRLEVGIMLRNIANAAIDISDGFIQDLSHILDASDVGAVVEVGNLPVSDVMQSNYTEKQAQSFAMTAGDDYELCFTVSPENQDALDRVLSTVSCPVTQVGRITASKGLQLRNKDELLQQPSLGYEHFSAGSIRDVSC